MVDNLDGKKLMQLNFNNGRRMEMSSIPVVKRNGAAIIQANPSFPTMADFKISGELGNGSFGIVYQAETAIFRDHKSVALKIPKCVSDDEDILQELTSLKQFSHPNIVRLLAAYFDLEPVFVLEEGVTLLSYPRECKPGASFLTDLLAGIKWMHQNKAIHCDIKPENILIVKGVAKLSDLGAVTKLPKGKTFAKLDKYKGTFSFSSLDTLSSLIVSPKSDIFSLAASLFEFISGHRLMGTNNDWQRKLIQDRKEQIQYYIDSIILGRVNERFNPRDKKWHPDFINSSIFEKNRGYRAIKDNVKRQNLKDRIAGYMEDTWAQLIIRMLNLESQFPINDVDDVIRDPHYRRIARVESRPDRHPVNKVKRVKERQTFEINQDIRTGLEYEFFYLDESIVSRKITKHHKEQKEAMSKSGHSLEISSDDKIIYHNGKKLEKQSTATRKRRPVPNRQMFVYKDMATGVLYYRCVQCKDKFYQQPQGVSRHKMSVHQVKKKIECIYCHEVFARKEFMMNHLKKNRCHAKPDSEISRSVGSNPTNIPPKRRKLVFSSSTISSSISETTSSDSTNHNSFQTVN